jgi:hypothetical protein
MRKNTAQVLKAFAAGKAARPAASIWTDGVSIFSYNTCLVTPALAIDGHPSFTLVLNRTSYSVTTSQHQTALAVALRDRIGPVLHDTPRGASPECLQGEAIAQRLLGQWDALYDDNGDLLPEEVRHSQQGRETGEEF